MAVDFTARELEGLIGLVSWALFGKTGSEKIRLLVILRKLVAERARKAIQK